MSTFDPSLLLFDGFIYFFYNIHRYNVRQSENFLQITLQNYLPYHQLFRKVLPGAVGPKKIPWKSICFHHQRFYQN